MKYKKKCETIFGIKIPKNRGIQIKLSKNGVIYYKSKDSLIIPINDLDKKYLRMVTKIIEEL